MKTLAISLIICLLVVVGIFWVKPSEVGLSDTNLWLSAHFGDPEAQFEMALFFENLAGLETEEPSNLLAKHIYWIERSASNAHPTAQFRYGDMLLQGALLSPAPKKAVEFLIESANNGNISSKETLGMLYLHELYPGTVPQDIKRGIFFLEQAALNEKITSQLMLGMCFADGDCGIHQNKLQAYYWLRRAAENNDKTAQAFLATLLQEDIISKPDVKRIEYWECLANSEGGFDAMGLCQPDSRL